MKTVDEMTAMEVCAYLVAKASKGLLGEEERGRLYGIHCAKLKEEVAAGCVPDASREFLEEMLREVRAEAGENPGGDGAESGRKEETA